MSLRDVRTNVLTAHVLDLKVRKSAGVPVSWKVKRLIDEADAARDAQDWRIAVERYDAALKLDPTLVHVWTQLGHALKESGNYEAARTAYLNAHQRAPSSADIHLHLGHLEKISGDLNTAVEHYTRALELDAGQSNALGELQDMTRRGAKVDHQRVKSALGTKAPAEGLRRPQEPSEDIGVALKQILDEANSTPFGPELRGALKVRLQGLLERLDDEVVEEDQAEIVFDTTDLLHYFRHARLPSGIQRVQLEAISALLTEHGRDGSVALVFFPGVQTHWVNVPRALFLSLCALCLESGDTSDIEWMAATQAMAAALDKAPPFSFREGATLVNLGTSWFANYLLAVRIAKRAAGISYVPFVHDLIPVVHPETCVKDVVQACTAWTQGAFDHADAFLVNSEHTKHDLLQAANVAGRSLPADRVAVVRLDADIRKPLVRKAPLDRLESFGIRSGQFVLFVSTVEPRKNHIGALTAWSTLIRRHGLRKIPTLVCVGGRGWGNEAVFSLYESNDALKSRVRFLSGIPDDELALLYQTCLFTVYPSLYEGWGLPVTESLCFGKTGLVSSQASLPEAGGEFVDYFDPKSPGALVDGLERLLFEPGRRESLERAIADDFRPREWRDLAMQIEREVRTWRAEDDERGQIVFERDDLVVRDFASRTPDYGSLQRRRHVPIAPLRRYFALDRTSRTALSRFPDGEIFRGDGGWWGLDDWGSWTKAQGATLRFRLESPAGALRVFIGLLGLPDKHTRFEITIETSAVSGVLRPSERRWIPLQIPEEASEEEISISINSLDACNLLEHTNGRDPRTIGIGVVGFYLCAAEDLQARQDFIEAITLNALDQLRSDRSSV